MYESKRVDRVIGLRNLTDVHEFVRLADACDFDVNIGYDRVMIDGKSIVGVMGLDLGRALRVQYDGFCPSLEIFLNEHPYRKKERQM